MENTLKLSEKLYLLSIRPEKGGINSNAANSLNFVLAGAILCEMEHESLLRIENNRFNIQKNFHENELYAYILKTAVNFRGTKRIRFWVRRFFHKNASIKKLLHQALVKKKLISLEKKSFLFFKWNKPHILDHKVIRELNQEFTHDLFRGTENEEQLMLLLLTEPLNILRNVYVEKDKRRAARKKLRTMSKNPQISGAGMEIVKAVYASIRAARAAAASAG